MIAPLPTRKLTALFLALGPLLAPQAGTARAVEIIAHRGASWDAPENTLAAVNLAWEQKADAVEFDVFLSKDGKIVAMHDATTKRTAGVDRRVDEQTLAELRRLDVGSWKGTEWADERIPTLDEILETVPEGRRLFIEIKCGPEIVPELVRVLRQAGRPPEQTAVIGFSHATMKAVKQALPDLQVYWIVSLKADEETGRLTTPIDDLIEQTESAGLNGLDLGRTHLLTSEDVRRIKQAGLGIYVWTINDRAEARRLKEAGVDGITTDRPGWLRDGLRPAERRDPDGAAGRPLRQRAPELSRKSTDSRAS